MPLLDVDLSDSNKVLRWTALGAFGLGGALFGLADLQNSEARRLGKLPDITSLKDWKPHLGKAVSARGEVTSPHILEAALSKREAVATYVVREQTSRTKVRDEWKEERKEVKRTSQCSPLRLLLRQGHQLHLKAGDKDVRAVLEHTVSQPHGSDRTLLRQTFDGVLGYMVTGYIDTEAILPVNTTLTAIGKLNPETGGDWGLDQIDGRLQLFRCTLHEQIRHLQRLSRALKWTACGFGLLGTFLTGVYCFRLGRRALQKRRQRLQGEKFLRETAERQQRARERAAAEGAPDPRPARADGSAENGSEWHCNVCWESDGPQTVFPACGHVAVCEKCAERLHHCPVCRTRSDARRIFYS